nr:MAG TPA: hypothetical protein [Caudoviricetes sp.]
MAVLISKEITPLPLILSINLVDELSASRYKLHLL